MPDEARLRDYADQIRKSLHSQRTDELNPAGDERNAAIGAMAHFLRECGYLVSWVPLNGGQPLNRLGLPDRALRIMGDDLSAGHKPYPDRMREKLGLSLSDWRSLEAALVKDGLIDYDNTARSEHRLTRKGAERYAELSRSRRDKALTMFGSRGMALVWALVGVILTLVVTDVYRRLTTPTL